MHLLGCLEKSRSWLGKTMNYYETSQLIQVFTSRGSVENRYGRCGWERIIEPWDTMILTGSCGSGSVLTLNMIGCLHESV